MAYNFTRSIILIMTFLALDFHLKAQPIDFANFRLEIKRENTPNKMTIPFKEIRVLDKRFDSAKLGYALFASGYKNILLDPSLSKNIEGFYRDNLNFTMGSNRTLVMVVRTLWMYEIRTGEEDQEDINDELRTKSKYILKADVYSFENNTYQAITRIDTVFEIKKPLKDFAAQFLSQSLFYTANKISTLDLEQLLLKKSKITEEDVLNYYDRRFKNPRILHDRLQRGIYLTFTDFLNSRPSLYQFSLEQDEESDYLYIEENGQEKLFTDFWGFSDGQDLYVNLEYNFFKLTRDKNTYSFWGCLRSVHKTPSRNKNKVVRYMAFGNLANLRSAKLKNILRPMQIDMETGVAY